MSTEILVEVEHLARDYGDRRVLRDIHFSLRRGEVLGFLGPNGAGKTTTMQILSGNLAPSEGRVRIAGHDLLDEPRAAKGALGYLAETPPLYRDLTVDEYLDYCAALNRLPRREQQPAREAAKRKCGLEEAGGRLIANLSKGYQQRVGIAQAIIHLPSLVILDEPTVGLDPIQIREIRALIRDLGREHSVILSTHILPEVQTVCDRVLIVHEGELVLDETIEQLERHMKTAAITVAFHTPPPAGEIERLAGVTAVQPERDGRLRILHQADANPTDELVRIAAERGWGLTEIRPGRLSLEQLFVELTAEREPPAGDGARSPAP